MTGYEDDRELLLYLYSLDEDDFRDISVTEFVRAQLDHDNEDVREIATIRLGCRAKDYWIFGRCMGVVSGNLEVDLVYYASLNALVCLSDNELRRNIVKNEIQYQLKQSFDVKRKRWLRTALSDIDRG